MLGLHFGALTVMSKFVSIIVHTNTNRKGQRRQLKLSYTVRRSLVKSRSTPYWFLYVRFGASGAFQLRISKILKN